MNYNLEELVAELEDQKYEIYETFVIDFDDVITAVNHLKKELREDVKFLEQETDRILKAINEDQQLPDSSSQAILHSSYYNNGQIQKIKEILGVDSDKKEEQK